MPEQERPNQNGTNNPSQQQPSPPVRPHAPAQDAIEAKACEISNRQLSVLPQGLGQFISTHITHCTPDDRTPPRTPPANETTPPPRGQQR